MPRVVITGGPGAGKTTLLAELSARGFRVAEESARAIIAERRARGESPRPPPAVFAREILRRDVAKYDDESADRDWVFFDRGVLEAIWMLHEVEPLPDSDLREWTSTYTFHEIVFLLPPWEAIFVNDAERDQTFAEAVTVYDRVTRWYRGLGYTILEVPPAASAERADFVLRALCAGGAARP
jgi:predicted ATPase